MTSEDEARLQAIEMQGGVFIDGNPFSNAPDAWVDGFIEGAMWATARAAMSAQVAPEPEWEWGWLRSADQPAAWTTRVGSRENAQLKIDNPRSPAKVLMRRRKAGPWEPTPTND